MVSLENLQPGPLEPSAPIVNLRHWCTDPYQTIMDFMVEKDILKRAITNGESEGSWRFKRFIYPNLKMLTTDHRFIR